MAIIVNDAINNHSPKPLDDKYFNGLAPWADVAAVNDPITGIPPTYRHIGLTVNIAGVEYRYGAGIADEDLVVKSATGGVQSVSGNIVDNTDPLNPVVTQEQADWTETDNTEPSYINNKPTTMVTDDRLGVAPQVPYYSAPGVLTSDAGFYRDIANKQTQIVAFPDPTGLLDNGYYMVTDKLNQAYNFILNPYGLNDMFNNLDNINRVMQYVLTESDGDGIRSFGFYVNKGHDYETMRPIVSGITAGLNGQSQLQIINNSIPWYWMNADGVNGDVIKTDGNGNLSFVSVWIDITYGDLVALINASGLTKGAYYRIVDFQTVYQIPNTIDIQYGAIEPLIVFANDVDSIDNKVFSKDYPNDYIMYDYTDNVCEDSTTPRPGSIVYRKDQIKNISFFYDWRNVVYRRWETAAGSGIYTVLTYNGEAHIDIPVIDITELDTKDIEVGFTNKPYSNYGKYDNNVFVGICSNNKIGSDSFDNTIQTQFRFNRIGLSFTENTIGDNFIYNNIGNGFGNNIIDYQFSSNTCKDDFIQNIIGYLCEGNDFGYNAHSNTILHNMTYNKIDGNFAYNEIGEDCQYNTIGDSFSRNVFLDNFKYNNIGLNCNNNVVGALFQGNVVGINMALNTIGNLIVSNNLGNHFTENEIGDIFYGNTVGEHFSHNSIGIYFQNNIICFGFASNIIGNEFINNKIGYHFSYNNIGNLFGKNLNTDEYIGNEIGNYCKFNYIGPGFRNNKLGNLFQNNKIGVGIDIEYTNLTGGVFNFGDSIYNTNGVVSSIRYDNGSDFMSISAIKAAIDQKRTFEIGDYIENGNGVSAEIANIRYDIIGQSFYDNIVNGYLNAVDIEDSSTTKGNHFAELNGGIFNNNFINNFFIPNTYYFTGIDLSLATILPTTYSKEVLINSDGVIVIRYVDASNNIQIDDINA